MMDGWGDQAYSKSDNLRNFVKHFAHKKMFTKLCKTLNKMYVPDGSKLSCGSIGKQSIKPEVAGRQAWISLSIFGEEDKKLCMKIAYIFMGKKKTKHCQAPASNKRWRKFPNMAMEAIPSDVTATKRETKACSVFLLTSCFLYSCFEARDFGGRRRRRRRRRRVTTHRETYLQTREQCMRSRQSSCEKMRLLMSQGNCNATHLCSSSCCCNPSRVLVSAAPPPPLLLSAAIPYQYEKSAAAAVAPISLSLSLARSLSSWRGRCYKNRASFRCNRKSVSGIARSGGKNLEAGFPVHGKKKASQQARARSHKHTTDDRCLSGNVFLVRNRVDRPSAMMLLLCIAPLDRGARSTACAKSVL